MPVELPVLFVLLAVVVAAQTVETVTGFGATVIALALGVHLVPLDVLVVTLVLIGLIQSSWIVLRGRAHVKLRLLLTRVLPPALVGLALGNAAFQWLDASLLEPVLGGFVMAFAAWRLWQLWRKREPGSLSGKAGFAWTAGGGFFHGLLAAGGPLIVSYASRVLPERHDFRSTLSSLWLLLNTILLGSYAFHGQLTLRSVYLMILLLPAVALGLFIGEVLHDRIDEILFRKVVQVVLLVVGGCLLA